MQLPAPDLPPASPVVQEPLALRRFADTKRPVAILAACIAAMLGAYGALELATGFHIFETYLLGDVSKLVFVCYLLILTAIFFAYFISAEYDKLNAQTLRLLLRTETVNWGSGQSADSDVDAHRRKGESVITAQAIFIAISVFLIGSIPEALADVPEGPGTAWTVTLLKLCLASAMISFVLILISIDAVETIFNRFREREAAIIRYFYVFSAKRKYYGFVLSFVALVFYVGATSPNIASLSIGSFIGIGYHCWFPDVTEKAMFKGEARAFRTILWVIPLAMIGLYGL